MRPTTISKEFTKSRDDANYVEIIALLPSGPGKRQKLRVKIRSNPYDFQSYSRIERWSGSDWKSVHSLTEKKTKTNLGSRAHKLTAKDFKDDRDELVRVAERIIG